MTEKKKATHIAVPIELFNQLRTFTTNTVYFCGTEFLRSECGTLMTALNDSLLPIAIDENQSEKPNVFQPNIVEK